MDFCLDTFSDGHILINTSHTIPTLPNIFVGILGQGRGLSVNLIVGNYCKTLGSHMEVAGNKIIRAP